MIHNYPLTTREISKLSFWVRLGLGETYFFLVGAGFGAGLTPAICDFPSPSMG